MLLTVLIPLVVAALFLVAVPLVNYVRDPSEKAFAAYLIFAVSFSAVASAVFLAMVGAVQRWPEAAQSNFILSPIGVVALSLIPAFIFGLWLASRPPYDGPQRLS